MTYQTDRRKYMDFRKSMKEIRQKKKIPQNKACFGIMDQSNFSKIERNERDLSTEILFKLSKNLNATMVDLEEIILQTTNYYKATLTQNNIRFGLESKEKLRETYQTLKEYRHEHAYAYRSYLICKKVFHRIAPENIPDITKKELEEILSNILQSEYHTHYDILNMAECVRYYSPETLVLVANKFFPLTAEKVNTPNRNKLEALSILLVNIADLIIDNKFYDESLKILNQMEIYIKHHNNYKQMIMAQYARNKITILQSTNPEEKKQAEQHINFLCETLKNIFNDNDLANGFKQETQTLIKTGEPVNYIFTTLE